MLIDAMNDPDGLQNTEASERDKRNALVALLAPHGEHLWHEQQSVTQQP